MSNLLKLLQPPEYKSKLKLYCNNCSNLNSYLCKVGEQKPHKQRIKIESHEQN